jgi:ABC-type cobalamin/Fe3+-siderophores transport system ATPase subunit
MLLACLLAGALAEDPKLLLLDELTTFLDVEDQFGVLEAVRAVTHTRRDVTAVWVTHRCAVQVLA